MLSVAVMVGKLVQQDVREWYPSTTGPRLPTMTDSLLAVPSNLSVPKVPEPNQAATSAHSKKEPQAWGACSTFPRDTGPQQGLLVVFYSAMHRVGRGWARAGFRLHPANPLPSPSHWCPRPTCPPQCAPPPPPPFDTSVCAVRCACPPTPQVLHTNKSLMHYTRRQRNFGKSIADALGAVVRALGRRDSVAALRFNPHLLAVAPDAIEEALRDLRGSLGQGETLRLLQFAGWHWNLLGTLVQDLTDILDTSAAVTFLQNHPDLLESVPAEILPSYNALEELLGRRATMRLLDSEPRALLPGTADVVRTLREQLGGREAAAAAVEAHPALCTADAAAIARARAALADAFGSAEAALAAVRGAPRALVATYAEPAAAWEALAGAVGPDGARTVLPRNPELLAGSALTVSGLLEAARAHLGPDGALAFAAQPSDVWAQATPDDVAAALGALATALGPEAAQRVHVQQPSAVLTRPPAAVAAGAGALAAWLGAEAAADVLSHAPHVLDAPEAQLQAALHALDSGIGVEACVSLPDLLTRDPDHLYEAFQGLAWALGSDAAAQELARAAPAVLCALAPGPALAVLLEVLGPGLGRSTAQQNPRLLRVTPRRLQAGLEAAVAEVGREWAAEVAGHDFDLLELEEGALGGAVAALQRALEGDEAWAVVQGWPDVLAVAPAALEETLAEWVAVLGRAEAAELLARAASVLRFSAPALRSSTRALQRVGEPARVVPLFAEVPGLLELQPEDVALAVQEALARGPDPDAAAAAILADPEALRAAAEALEVRRRAAARETRLAGRRAAQMAERARQNRAEMIEAMAELGPLNANAILSNFPKLAADHDPSQVREVVDVLVRAVGAETAGNAVRKNPVKLFQNARPGWIAGTLSEVGERLGPRGAGLVTVAAAPVLCSLHSTQVFSMPPVPCLSSMVLVSV